MTLDNSPFEAGDKVEFFTHPKYETIPVNIRKIE